jgi:hypothetical protein
MMNHLPRFLALLAVVLSFSLAATAHESGAPLTPAQKKFLAQYETVRAALADDDLAAARKAAATIADNENAENLAKSATLAEARLAFKKLSKRAVHLAEEQAGYYIADCPQVEGGGGRWVQTDARISNPYFGKAMPDCGTIVSGDTGAGAPEKNR